MTRDNPICRICDTKLCSDNWYPSRIKKCDYICNTCHLITSRQWRAENGDRCRELSRLQMYKNGAHPMNENKECSLFLGVHVAEEVLCRMFKNVTRMPHGNPGYDFICNNGYLIDSKSSCIHIRSSKNPLWMFSINKNMVADYFILLAFDNRCDIKPLHIWMIPGDILNHLTGTSISESTIDKWNEYRLDIDKVISCCDRIRNSNAFNQQTLDNSVSYLYEEL